MRVAAIALGSGILVLVASLLVGRAAAGAAEPRGGALPPGIEQALAAREYQASANAQGLQAPNRAHGLRTYFEPTGIRVHDRTAPGSPELFSLTLSGVGRGEALASVAPGDVTHAGARVEIRRPGLVEWYVNAPEGLEQGFTLAKQPAGEGSLVLELRLNGASASVRGEGLAFETRAGRSLRYANLAVSDASGQPLSAHLAAPSPERVRLVVEDARAVYPLVIDPLLTATADTLLESDQASSNLGFSVSGAGDVNGDGYADVIVGAYQYDAGLTDEGAAFIFLGSAAGIASAGAAAAAAQLESDQFSANLGSSVASAGDVNGDGYADVIVGARSYALPSEQAGGAAFVFHGSASGIADGSPATAATTLASTQYSSFFGDSVASAGDANGDGYADVIVGARFYDSIELDEGVAFVFHGSATGVASGGPATAATQLESNQGGAHLGFSVASAGDVNGDGYADVIVGAPFYDAGQTNEGSAFVFLGSASGIASGNPATAATQLEANQGDATFGVGVASAGDVNGDGYADVIVGATLYDAAQTNGGTVFIFHGGASGIPSGGPATAATQLESDQSAAFGSGEFGHSVASAGDVNGDGYADVIVGAPAYDAGQGGGEGAAFVFQGGSSGVGSGGPTTAAAQLESNQTGATFGQSVAGAGDVNGDGYSDVIVGAPFYDAGPADEGAAFVYHGGARGILDGNPTTASAELDGDQAPAQLGWSVASAGDVNGDGYSDVIVGAPFYDAGQASEGAAFIFHGSPSGIGDGGPATAATQLESNQVGGVFGWSVAGAGDVNGDGYGDVIVGANLYNAGQTDEGAAFVFLGGPSGIADGNPATASAQLESNQGVPPPEFGVSVAGAGDVNGDGYADVIVGSRSYDVSDLDEGAAFVFLGSASGIADGNPATASARLESDQGGSSFGSSVASAGDVNGDGYADVIVGAGAYFAGEASEGAAFVFLGSSTGIADGSPATAAAQLEGNQGGAGSQFGVSVASAGDVNGDGYADVIVGSHAYDAGQTDEGAAFVFHGSATGIADGNPSTAATQLESNVANALFGNSVASAGDVNGDGFADVIVGADSYNAGQTFEGAAFVFLGSATGIADGNPSTAAAQLESNLADAYFGNSVAPAGDVNGDGFADVIVGAYRHTADEGAAYVFYGGGNQTGRRVLTRQLRGDGSTKPVQPWGASYDIDDFQVRMTATHPAGRGRVKLQVEACPRGLPFQSMACVGAQGTWTDVTASPAGVTLSQTVAFSPVDKLYRWRARVLYAPFSVTQPGITSPPSPAHGPWRRLSGQAFEADVRVRLDTDGDGISDGEDPDDDNDGLSDAAELLLGTDPLDEDTDGDLVCDGGAQVGACTAIGPDNCPFISNVAQQNGDAFVAGDACQCGDVTGEGTLTALDYQRAREHVAGRTPGGPFDADRCDVTGDLACGVEDLAVLDRLTSGAPATLVNACAAYGAP